MRNVNQQSSDSDCSQQESSIPKRHITSNGPEISFEISFQEVIKNNNANVMIPGNIDEYWNSIGCRSSFSNVLSFLTQLTEVELLHIFELDNKEHVFDEEERKIHSDDNDSNSANENNSPHHSVSDLSDFHELVKFFHKILKQDVVVQFLQGNKLCIDRLFEINSSLNESREGKNSNGDQNNDPSQNIEVISNSNDNPFSDNNFASENSSNETANSSENNQKGEDSSSSHQYISAGSFNSEVSNDALPEKTKVLFFSFLEIIKTVMSKIQQLEDRRKILRKFAYFLIPQEILDDFGNHQSIYVITFLPIITGKYYSWLVLLKDKSIILASIDGLEVHYKKRDFKLIQNNHSIIIKNKCFKFINKDQFIFFQSFFKKFVGEGFEDDLLHNFLKSLKLTVNLADKYPPVIKRQFFDYLGRADMNMALALFEQPSTILSREICFQLHNCMYDTSMFSCFLRYIFNKDIEDTTEPGTLLRGNNAATMTASTFLVKFGSDIASNIVKELVDKIDNGYDETENIHIFAIKTIISNCHDLPLAMKIIIYNVFRATRRKYPNHRIPLIAIGSILMLRMFIPILSQNEKTKFLVQGLMNAFIFRYDKVNDSINEMSNQEMINPEMNEETKRKNYDQKILYKVAEFICQIINIDDGDYNHRINFRRIDFEGIIKYIADNFDPISEKVKEVGNIKNIESNPLIPSFMELIENIFTGNERDFSCILETNSLFDINV